MITRTRNAGIPLRLAAVLIAVGIFAAPAFAAETAVAPERNPPGDIPDTQTFVPYASPLGFTIKVPEGWARKTDSSSARFADKYNTIDIIVTAQTAAPTTTSATSEQVADLKSMGRAVKVTEIKDVKVSGSTAVLIAYTSNSEPNPVTNKKVRLEHDRYLFFKDGKLVTLDLAAPQGADNVDAWLLMADSFRWQ
jgi:hypothetical protein